MATVSTGDFGSGEDDIDIFGLTWEDDGLVDYFGELVDPHGDGSFHGDLRKTNDLDTASRGNRVKSSGRGVFLHDADGGLIDENAARLGVERAVGEEGRAFANEDGDILASGHLQVTA